MQMKITNIIALLLLITTVSCSKDEGTKSSYASITKLELLVNGKTSQVTLPLYGLTIEVRLPYGTTEVTIKTLEISKGASASRKTGDVLSVADSPVQITVTSEDSKNVKEYEVLLNPDQFPTVVGNHGLLKVSGNKIVNKNNDQVSFAGNCFFWTNDNWGGEKYYTPEVVSWLKNDWETTIVRAAMGVEDDGGYISNPQTNKARVKKLVDAAIAEGIYVIIDWHSHHAEDHTAQAVDFFREMAQTYGEYENVIYEIYNEPLNVSWTEVVKPYSETVIAAIRVFDPDNMIVVGSPEWSQRLDLVADDPITTYSNIAYSIHFYSVNHKQWLRDRATTALNNGIALFATEWGSIGYTQNDPEAEFWMQWCKDHKISHCNWVVNDKEEAWSILKKGTSTLGNWPESSLTEAGKHAKNIIKNWPE
jgi:endoglucanase